MAITKATKLIVGLLATGGVSGGVAGGYYLLKPKSSESSTQTTDTVPPTNPDSMNQNKGDSGAPSGVPNPPKPVTDSANLAPGVSTSGQQPSSQSPNIDRSASEPSPGSGV